MNFLLDRFPLETFVEMESSLRARGDKVPIYVLTHQSRKQNVKGGADCFYDRDIACGLVTSKVPFVLNREAFKKASEYEGLAVSVFSRFSIGQKNFSAQEMSSHYFELYNFWTHQIIKHQIDFCLQHYMPHDPSSFVLYLVLKSRKVPVVFVDVPHIFNKFRPLACSFEYRNLLLLGDKDSLNINFLSESLSYKSQLHSNGVDAIPKTIRFRHNETKPMRLRKVAESISKLFLGSCRAIFNLKSWHPAERFFKVSRRAWSSPRSDFSNASFFFFMKRTALQLVLERRKYESKCITSLPAKFVYFAMSAQPEGTTLPAALEFRDIFSILRILREAIPAGIPILLKENPSVFETRNPYLSAVSYRAPDYYQRLLEIPNVNLVSVQSKSHELIKKSLLVATINGTAALEAVYSGIPAVIFGSIWHEVLDGVYKYESPSQLAGVWQTIIQGGAEPSPQSSDCALDRMALIEFEEHNPYEFHGRAQKDLVKAFLASIEKFARLDDRKWAI